MSPFSELKPRYVWVGGPIESLHNLLGQLLDLILPEGERLVRIRIISVIAHISLARSS